MMKFSLRKGLVAVGIVAAIAGLSLFSPQVEAEQQFRARQTFPVPTTVSEQAQALIAKGISPMWLQKPQTVDEWHKLVQDTAAQTEPIVLAMSESLGVNIVQGELGGVPIFMLYPRDMPAEHDDKILLHLHGGGFVFNPGLSAAYEGVQMAGLAKYRVAVVDYRMAPDHPYPAAVDDCIAVYRELLKSYPAEKIGVFGASAGGGLSLVLPLRAKADGLPMPGAVEAGTPCSDMEGIGDSYYTNEGVDSELVTCDGMLSSVVDIYAAGHDRKDPMIAPIYADVTDFPPTMLTTGTRDIFLSNTVRMHEKLRLAGRDSELYVFEGLSHYQYLELPGSPEQASHFKMAREFFEKHLK